MIKDSNYKGLSPYEVTFLLHHAVEAQRWDLAATLLVDFEYVDAFLNTPARAQIVSVFESAHAKLIANGVSAGPFYAGFMEFIRSNLYFLIQFPQGVFQQAINSPSDSAISILINNYLRSKGKVEIPHMRWLNKSSTNNPLILRINGENGWMQSCAWLSSDQVASVSDGSYVQGWSRTSGELLFEHHIPGIEVLSFSEDGECLLASKNGEILIIETKVGTVTAYPTAFGVYRAKASAWTQKKDRIAIGGEDGIIILDRLSGESICIQGNGLLAKCCAWSPDGNLIAICVGAEPIQIWDVTKGASVGQLGDARMVVKGNVHSWTTFAGHRGGANTCSWSPDGRLIASASGHGFGMHDDDFSVRLWDGHTYEEIHVFEGHRDKVLHVHWSPDSKKLATASGSVMTPGPDNTIRIWDVNRLKALGSLHGHTNEVVNCRWHTDSNHLLSCSKDGSLAIWDALHAETRATPARHICPSPDASHIATLNVDHSVSVIAAESSHVVAHFEGHQDEVTTCAWAPNGQFLATGSLDRTVRIWDVFQQRHVGTLTGHTGDETYTAGGQRMVWGAINDLVWAPSGDFIASAGSDRRIFIWDFVRLCQHRMLLGHTGPVIRCAWDSEGTRLVSAGGSFEHIQDMSTLLWDANRGCELCNIPPDCTHLESFRTLAWPYLPDQGYSLASGTIRLVIMEESYPNTSLEFHEVATGKAWSVRTGHRPVLARSNPCCTRLIVGDAENLRVFDVVTQGEILRFPLASRVLQICVADGSEKLFVLDEAGTLYILTSAVPEGDAIRCHLPEGGRTKDEDVSQSESVEDTPSSVTLRLPCWPTSNSKNDQAEPCDPANGEAWLRFIRGHLVNHTAQDEELRDFFFRLALLEPTSETYSAAIKDPYAESIGQLNAALWTIGASLLRDDKTMAKKFLETALVHDPGNEQARFQLADLNA